MRTKLFLIIPALVAFTLFVRLAFHLPNATPLTAIALVCAVYLGRKWAVIVPLVALFISDVLIGFYEWRVMVAVYASFAVIGLSSYLLKKYPGVFTGAALVLGSSFFFFITTNFAVWAFSPWYAKSIEGLLYCYSLGLPFYRNMLLGDALYTPLLFGVFMYGAEAVAVSRTITKQLVQAIRVRV